MAVPLIIMAASAALDNYAKNNAAQANIGAENNALQDSQKYQGDISSQLKSLIGGLSTDTPAAATAKARGDYLTALQSAMPGSKADINGGAGYNTDAAREAVGQHNAAINLADMLSKITGPTTERRLEGYNINDAGSKVNELTNFERGQLGVDRMGMQNLPDQGQEFLANLGMAYGMGQLGKPGKI